MIELDQYLRAGLDELVNDVIHAATRWRDNATEARATRLREAIDALAEGYVGFDELVEDFYESDGTPGVMKTKGGIR